MKNKRPVHVLSLTIPPISVNEIVPPGLAVTSVPEPLIVEMNLPSNSSL